ncbi:MAG TPA: phospholipid carrier-dependent glycosyltransferase [Gaiellaceae bacterium]|nr:phospholipid carrier-dependent glycosyltransferase [Gaiellaceae bacterium]
MDRRSTLVLGLVVIAFVGLTLRLVGTNWDDGKHLHPDERYLSVVADNTELPTGPREYFDVDRSPLSPYNTSEGTNYLYGMLPLTATSVVATAVGQDGYGELNLVGRRLAALVDGVTIFLVFGISWLLLANYERRRRTVGALLAAALYAFTVTAIQHAHFFTTDIWVAMMGTLTFFLALRSLRSGVEEGSSALSLPLLATGAALGLTVACKASGALIVLPVGIALLGRATIVTRWAGGRSAIFRLMAESGLVVVTTYLAFRLASPYTFQSSNWLDLSLNPQFRDALERQADAIAGPSNFPPAYQWLLSQPIWTPLRNLALWQLGVPLAFAGFVGLAALAVFVAHTAVATVRARAWPAADVVARVMGQLMIVSFVALVFLRFGTPFVHTGRYLLPLVPLLPVCAAFAVVVLTGDRARLRLTLSGVLVALTAIYALAFVQIYDRPNTRIEATRWIQANVPPGSTIANEHWDDSLPVGGIWGETVAAAKAAGGYRGLQIPVFDPDDEAKLRKLYEPLRDADYYVLSSPRAWRTIGRLPDRFPLMTRFYADLFAGKLGYAEVESFTSEPGLLGVQLNDVSAEEAFWVYDHPPVRIFKRTDSLRLVEFRDVLCPAAAPPYC